MMGVTLMYGDRISKPASLKPHGDDLWISLEDLTAATGWEHKPQGLCLGEQCVPIPPSHKDAFFSADGRFNIAAFAAYLNQPYAHDDDTGVWVFGESAASRTSVLQSLMAPDFTLPDLDGVRHSLSDYRGKKVLLLSWASW